MSAATQMNLAISPWGRILLHLLALSRDGKLRWHAAGIAREFSRIQISLTPTPST